MKEDKSYKQLIEEGYQKAQKNLSNKRFKFLDSRYFFDILAPVLGLFILCGIIYPIAAFTKKTPSTKHSMMVFSIVYGLVALLALILGIVWYFNHKKKNKILSYFDFDEIYKKAFYEISNIKGEFIQIDKTIDMDLDHLTGDAGINNILHIKRGNNLISAGTVTTKEEDSDGDEDYYCYRVMKVKLDKSLDLEASLKAKGLIFRRDNVDMESNTFEKLFDTYATDQIKIRCILTPKVIDNLIKLSGNSKKSIPQININNDNITFIFPGYSVTGYDVPDYTIKSIYLTKKDQIVEEINQKIISDYELIKEIIDWFEALNLEN